MRSGAHSSGGVTRILIIEDDRKPFPPLLSRHPGENQALEGAETDPATEDPAQASAADARTVVHEFQVPMHLAGAADADQNHAAAGDLDERGHPDASVIRELIARVEELLHRTRARPAGASTGWAGTIRFGSVLLEPATQTVLRGGQPVRVTHTEFRLLLALMRRRGAIASRMELLREVWGAGAAVSRRAVDTHIARLRRKLEDDPANPRHILTALAWGYRFRP
ncbi:MAG: winged helix-turn-helix domain-containing protein [Gemmatimonadales bacterium]